MRLRPPPPSRLQMVSALAAVVFLIVCPRPAAGHPQPHFDGDPVPPRGDFGIFASAFAGIPAFAGALGSCSVDDQTPAQSFLRSLSDFRSASCGGTYATTDIALTDEGNSRSVWNLEGVTAAVGSGTTTSGTNGPAGSAVSDFFEDAFLVTSTVSAAVVIKKHVTATTAGDSGYDVWTDAYLVDPAGGLHALTLIHPFDNTPGHDVDVVSDEFPQFDKDIEIVLPPLPPQSVVLLDAGIDFTSTGPAPSTSAVSSSVSVCPTSFAVEIDSLSGATGDCEQPGDLTLVSLQPVQSIRDPQELFSGKPTVLLAEIESTFPHSISTQISFTVRQDPFPDTVFSETLTLPSGKECSGPIDFYFPSPAVSSRSPCEARTTDSMLASGFQPLGSGRYLVIGELAAVHGETDLTNNRKSTVSLPVVDSELLTPVEIGYTQIQCEAGRACSAPNAGYGSFDPAEYGEAIRWANAQTLAMYPVGPNAFTGLPCSTESGAACSTAGNPEPCFGPPDCNGGLVADAQNAYLQVRDREPFANRPMAFVPAGYFTFHHALAPGAHEEGLQLSIGHGHQFAFVSADAQSGRAAELFGVHDPTVAHELGHTFGLPDLRNPNNPPPQPVGFWVGCHSVIANTFDDQSTCEVLPQATASDGLPHTNLMTPSFPGLSPPQRWIENSDFERVASRLGVNDPSPVLVFTGSLTTGWNLQITRIETLASGRPDEISTASGEFVRELLDEDGNILMRESDDVEFQACEAGCFAVPSLPVLETIAFPPSATKLRFLRGTTILLDVDPLSASLRYAFEHVEDAGFAQLPTERRKALLEKTSAIEKMISGSNRRGALQMLQNDLEKKAENWLVDYQPDDQLDFSKRKVMGVIGDVESRLKYQLSNP